MAKYALPEGGLEVLLLAIEILDKYGYKYPSIVTEDHYKLADQIKRELLLIGAEDGKAKDK